MRSTLPETVSDYAAVFDLNLSDEAWIARYEWDVAFQWCREYRGTEHEKLALTLASEARLRANALGAFPCAD